MEFSINANCLYRGMSLEDSMPRIKVHGYDVVEAWSLTEQRRDQIRFLLDEYSMSLSCFCPNYFILNNRRCHDQYEESLRQAISYAETLSCKALITQVGADTGESRLIQHDAIVSGLKRMAPLLEKSGITLLVEPLNDVKDHKGYYLTSSEEGFDIIQETGSPNVRLLYDIYHQLHMGEDVEKQILDHLPLIGHFHVAGFPARDAHIFDGYDYAPLFRTLREQKTRARIGLELMPSSPQEADALLDRLNEYR